MKSVFSVDMPTKLRTAVDDSSVSPVLEMRTDRCTRQRNVQGVWVEISLFRKLRNGFGLSFSLEPGIKVVFVFAIEN